MNTIGCDGGRIRNANWGSDEPHELSLRARVSVDLALGRFDGPMPRKQLHVPQVASGVVDVAGGDRDKAASWPR